MASTITLRDVGPANWRDCAALEVLPEQRAFVAAPSYYLALCCYDEVGWSPLAVQSGDEVVGFLMWAVDEADGSCWLGGFFVGASHQRRGYGGAALRAALALLHERHGFRDFALSYAPANVVAATLYRRFGFEESGEMAEDELVARRRYP